MQDHHHGHHGHQRRAKKRRTTAAKRRTREHRTQNEDTTVKSSSSSSSLSSQSNPVRSIPGFYYDEETKRYYRVDQKKVFVKPTSSSSSSSSSRGAANNGDSKKKRAGNELYNVHPSGSDQSGRSIHGGHGNGVWSILNARERNGDPMNRGLLVRHLIRSRAKLDNLVCTNEDHSTRLHGQRMVCIQSNGQSFDIVASLGSSLVCDTLERPSRANSINNVDDGNGLDINNRNHTAVQIRRHWQYVASSEISSISHCVKTGMVAATTLGGSVCGEVYISKRGQQDLENYITRVFSFQRRSIWCSTFNNDGSMLAIGASKEGTVLDCGNSWRPKCRFFCKDRSDIFCQVFDSQNDNLLYCGLRNGNLRVVDLRIAMRRYQSTSGMHRINRGSFFSRHKISAPGSLITLDTVGQYGILASTVVGGLYLFDTRMLLQPKLPSRRHASTTRPLLTFEGHVNTDISSQVPVLVGNNVGSFVMAAGTDQKIRVWDLQRGGQPFHTLDPPQRHRITCMQWMPDDSQSVLISGRAYSTGGFGSLCGLSICEVLK